MGDAATNRNEPAGEDRDLVTVETAAEILEVPVEQVRVMAEEGMLTPESTPSGPRYHLAEVRAVRLLGG